MHWQPFDPDVLKRGERMSISSEIQRLENAKTAIANAIEAKGVTVPSSATLDEYATYVSQISQSEAFAYKFSIPQSNWSAYYGQYRANKTGPVLGDDYAVVAVVPEPGSYATSDFDMCEYAMRFVNLQTSETSWVFTCELRPPNANWLVFVMKKESVF